MMMNGSGGAGVGSGGVEDRLGEKPLTVNSVLKEFQDLKDKFKNDDEDDCEWPLLSVTHAFVWLGCKGRGRGASFRCLGAVGRKLVPYKNDASQNICFHTILTPNSCLKLSVIIQIFSTTGCAELGSTLLNFDISVAYEPLCFPREL